MDKFINPNLSEINALTDRMKNKILLTGFIFFRILTFSQDVDAELTLQQTNIEINNNKLIKNLFYQIKINNRAGEKYTKIVIPYSKLSKVYNVEACIKDSKGTIVKKLNKKDIIDRSSIASFSFYEDDFVKEFILKHDKYPYTIEYSYQIRQNEFLYIDYWSPIIDDKIPTKSARLRVNLPSNYGITYKGQFTDEPKIDSLNKVISYQWHTSYSGVLKSEVYSPPISKLLPAVSIVPKDFTFDKKGSFKDWISYGNWQYELLKGLNDLPDIEKRKINSLTDNVSEIKDKIKKMYHYLQDETRYVNVTIETGGMKPYPANYVAQNKYGDCKALTNYFKSILDYLQIPSYYTKVFAGNPINQIDKNFPSQQFNHVILYVPQEDEDIWLDCTSDGAFNYLGTFTQNRDAFIINYENSNFIKTPTLKPEEVLDTRTIEMNFNTVSTSATFQNTYKGESYENMLQLMRNYNELDKSKIVRNYMVADGFQMDNYQLIATDRDADTIELKYEATAQNIYKNFGNEILVSNLPFSLPNFEKPQIRKLPVQLDYPIHKLDTLLYNIPYGYKLHKSPNNYEVKNKFGEYKFNSYEKEGKITIVKSLLINSGEYTVLEYPEFYDFIKQVTEIENKIHISLFK